MLSTDANILKIKHEILYQVAKLAFAGELEERRKNFHTNFFLDHRLSIDAAYIRKEKL